jgi:alpha-mannosidase
MQISLKPIATILISCGFMLSTCLHAQQLRRPAQQWQEKYPKVIARLAEMSSLPVPHWLAHTADIPHGEDPSLKDPDWTPVDLTGTRAAANTEQGPAWYRTAITIPATVGGKDIRGTRLRLAVRFSSDGRVFFNGGLVAQGLSRTLDPILITEKAVPGQSVLVAVKVPFHTERSRFFGAQVLIDYPGQPDPGVLGTEIESAEALISGFPESKSEHEKQLDEAVGAIDLAALDRGDQLAFSHSLDTAGQRMAPLNGWMKQFTIRLVGNAHIDMAWLWPWTETVEVVRDTFNTVLQLMDEYPRFRYAQSSVQDFEWLEQKYPAEFKQIQARVKEGRWELVGGMWVEPDLNMPDGESLVRQILVGKRYFQHKFGVDVNIGWNPDSFGYSWQLPQIYKRSGFDSFVTQKMSWNETTQFPYKLFWWQSPDGSKVLTYFPHDYSGGINPVSLANDLATYVPKTGFPEIMQLYGVGDHGGGPTRQMLDEGSRLADSSLPYPKVEFSTARGFFDDLENSIQNRKLEPPVWNNELYLEYHRGCYTTQSETKKEIRHNEEQLQNAEKFASLAFVSEGQPYSNSEFEEIWKKVLFDEFHDIMPGSGVGNNYADAAKNLSDASLESGSILRNSLGSLTARINTQGRGIPVVVYNSLSWPRTGPVTIEVHSPAQGQHLEARDASGHVLLSQVLSHDDATEQTKLQVMVRSLPSLGYTVLHVSSAAGEAHAASPLKVAGTDIENEFFRLRIDPKTGCITSLINKRDGKEAVAPGGCGNLLQTFVDRPLKQDAWEIRFDQQSWDLKQPQEVSVVESGPERAVVRIKNRFQKSTFVQNVIVYAGVPRIDVEMTVDWHEEHILLKAGFPVNVQKDKATFEIPYGTIQRPTTRNTPEERAQFEVPALRWGDLSNENQGFSLLNASKYGYDAKGNVIRLSLLRSPTMPAPDNRIADQGLHEFTYALYPHSGDWKAGSTMRAGYELNFPLIPVTAQPHAGAWPNERSFAAIEPANVILTAVKKAEDSDALIFRFYEFEGKAAQVRLQLPEKATEATVTNLMEKSGHATPLAPGARELVVPTGPYEINTVQVSFGKDEK